MDKKYQTTIKRFIAALIDSVILSPLFYLSNYLLIINHNYLWSIVITSLFSYISILYSIFLHKIYGQTLGKMLLKIIVVDVSETSKIKTQQAFIRDSPLLLIITINMLFFLLQYSNSYEDAQFAKFNNINDSSYFLWSILELITMFTNYKRRSLHDFIAKTVVVNT